MKLVKFLPAFAATAVLAACSSNTPAEIKPAAPAAEQAPATTVAPVSTQVITNKTKSVVYSCQSRKSVTASYAFQDEQARAVTIVVGKGKKAQALPALTRDEANKDFASFTSDKYVWNVDSNFKFDNATQLADGMLTEKGTESDKILAKDCRINKSATAKLNK